MRKKLFLNINVIIFVIFTQQANDVYANTPPSFTTLPKEETIVLLNERVALSCVASGSPNPNVVNWLIDNKPVNFGSSLYTLRSNGELQISQTSKSDSGDYQCVARNSVGGVASDKRRLTVAYFEQIPRPPVERISKSRYEYFSASPPKISCSPKPMFIWKKNGVVLKESDRVMISMDGDLYISTLELADQGTYTLTIENPSMKGIRFASQAAKQIILSVSYGSLQPPNSVQIIFSSKKQSAGELKTESITLECFTTGLSPDKVQITWKRVKVDGKHVGISSNSKYVFTNNGQRLVIKKPTYENDNGVFLCEPYLNLQKLDSRKIQLDVFAPPGFGIKPTNVEGFTDNSTSIDCRIYGYPSVGGRWYKNGVPIISNDKYTILTNNTLLINKLNWEDDGLFQCGAENFAALKFAQVEVTIKNISSRIENEFRDIFVGFKTNVIIPCVVTGAPKPEVYWTLNATRIIFPRAKYTQFANGSLQIVDMSAGEGGIYECVADNKINIARKRLKVFAVVETKFSKVPKRETSVRKGADIRLPCKVQHDPNINYTREWRHNNMPINNKRYIVEKDGTLLVKFAQHGDTGIDFSCHIFSSAGNISTFTTLVLVQLPANPSVPRVTEIQAYAFRLSWDTPSDGGSPLIEYILKMKNYTEPEFHILVKHPATSSTFMVNNLQAGGRYKFKVSASNKFGIGDESSETPWIKTKTLAPSVAPYGLQAVSSTMDSVTLAWVIPPRSTHNGDLLGFMLNYRLASSPSDFSQIYVKGGARTIYVMSGLPIFTRYEVRIAAHNEAGIGKWSTIQFVETKQGIPTLSPTNVSVSVLNDSSVEVYFQSPPQEFWNGKLTEIIARTWPPNRPQDQSVYRTHYDQSSLRQQTFVLPGLKADTEYTLAVSVGTTGGPSPGSAPVQFKTSEGVPEAVQDLQVSGIYSDAFTVSWKPPLETAGRLKNYLVQYRLYGIGGWLKLVESPLARGAVIKGLKPRTRYEVKVAAKTLFLGPEMSASVTTIESPILPTAPSNLKAYNTWGNVISLGWTPGDSGRAVILHYLIEYNNDTDYHRNPKAAVWRLIRNLTKILENPANLTYLRPSTTYRFRMTAYNRVGYSPISNISEDITTGEGIPSKPPTGISASAPEIQMLLIRWTPPSKISWHSGSIKYQFIIKPKGQDPKILTPPMELADTQATSYFARGLNKYTLYNITIRLFNDKGHGPWSKPFFARTSEDYPSGAPMNVKARVIDASSIRVSWGPVPEHQRNGVILGYKVYYKIKDMPETELFKDFKGNTTFLGVITGLSGFTDYEIQLLAYTKVGGIFKSNPVTEKTERGLPGPPRDIRFNPVTYSLVTVKWNIPARPNGDILFYEVKYRENATGSTWTVNEATVGPFRREAIIRSLRFNVYYVFEIRAKSAAGWGQAASEYLLVTTDRQTPESPVILAISLSSVRTNSIILRWKPRFDGNSPIRAYNLQYNREFTGWTSYKYGIPPLENVPANFNELEVKKLQPGTSYQFRVRAINDLGSSPWSDISRRQTTHSEVATGAPFNARVKSKTPSSLVIAWDPPKYSILTGQLRGYKIKYKLVGGIRDYVEVSLSSTQQEYLLSNLKAFSPYDIGIGAFNSEGKGTWTPSYTWRTGDVAPMSAPKNVKITFQGSSKVRVQWTPPDLESVRGYTLGFKIESVRLDGRRRKRRSTDANILKARCPYIPSLQTHLAGPYSTEVTLKNLRKYTRYSISVRVFNSFSDGPKSNPVVFTTPKDVPGPPYILSERVYTNLIDIDYAQPCEPNGQVLGYKVEYRENRGNPFPPIVFARDEHRVRIVNLKPNTYYLLELSARTSVGYGLKASIDFYTKQGTRKPSPPGPPSVYENKASVLTLKWEERDNGNMPVNKFYIRYRKAKDPWTEYRPIGSNEVRYDDAYVVYSIVGLKSGQTYYFQVKSQTDLGISDYSESSKPIITAQPLSGDKPIYEKMWFIFLMIIIFLLIIIAMAVCCWYCQCRKKKYKPSSQPYAMSSFQTAMVRNGDGDSSKRLLVDSRNGSIAPSVASSKKSKPHGARRSSAGSLAKSFDLSDNDADKSSDETEYNRRQPPEASIANHYSNDPYAKNWRDSMDKQTKKALLSEFARRPSQASVNTLNEKKRFDSREILDRPRPRPGRPDLTERKKLARSEPFLDQQEDSYQPQQRHQQQRPLRPGKRQVDRELARSEPDLNRPPGPPDSQVTRQSSFLRATAGDDSDNESLRGVYEREKSKRDMALEYDNRMDNFYPNTAPPPYDFNAAPPAYSPSEQDDRMSDDLHSERSYSNRNRPYIPPKPRTSNYSDSSDGRYQGRPYNPPKSDRGFYNPEKSYSPRDGGSSASYNTPEPTNRSQGQFSPPQSSRFDDELYEDGVDGYEPDMTLV